MIPPVTTTTQPQGEKGGPLANYLRSRQSLADLAGTLRRKLAPVVA